MFATGDRVMYPLHGGAVIKDIEQREQDGKTTECFILQMLLEKMTVSIPVSSAEKVGLRLVVSGDKLEEAAAVLRELPDTKKIKSISWNRRFQLYMDKMKSGNIIEVARVVRILSLLENARKISVGERRLLHSARQILLSEIMLVKDVDEQAAGDWLDKKCS